MAVSLISPLAHHGVGADGNLASAAELVEQGALADRGQARRLVVQEGEMLAHHGVAEADFDAERALSGGRAHDLGLDDFLDVLGFAEALEAGGGQNHGVVFALFQLAHAGVHVAAQGKNLKVGAELLELGLTAQAAGADAGALRQFLDAVVANRQEGIARIDPLGDGRDLKGAGQRRWEGP